MSVEEIEAKRAARKAKSAEAKAEQYAADLQAIDDLECKHGYELETLSGNHVAGVPVVVGVRPPSEVEYKRYFQKVNRAGNNPDARAAAHLELGECCWVYPEDKEQRKSMLAATPGLLAGVGNLANKLAELKADDEKNV